MQIWAFVILFVLEIYTYVLLLHVLDLGSLGSLVLDQESWIVSMAAFCLNMDNLEMNHAYIYLATNNYMLNHFIGNFHLVHIYRPQDLLGHTLEPYQYVFLTFVNDFKKWLCELLLVINAGGSCTLVLTFTANLKAIDG